MTFMYSIPNILTGLRILVIPIVIGVLYLPSELGCWMATLMFIFACATDFLDGYLARTLQQETRLGTILDPVADKLLVASTLLMLTGLGRIYGYHLIPAIVILCREILVSGLREFLAQASIKVPVTYLAKWKTTLQMVAIGSLILNNPFPQFISLPTVALTALWAAAALTLLTGYDYLRKGLKHI